MKPITVENNQDCTVSVQVVTPYCGDIAQPKEIALLIENEKGEHLATFTPQQVTELMQVLHASTRTIFFDKTN